MDAITTAPAGNGRAIEFTGTLREFIPIAVTNTLLTIATLFVYRSWAKARERRYLWSRTRFIDDELQWTGTGLEMFLGFVMIAVLFGGLGLLFTFGLPAVAIQIGPIWMFVAVSAIYVGGFFLYGVARFRGLRYRLSRTWWHGIRGGSHDGGWDYGRKALGYYLATFVLAGVFYPWAQAKLWNERWRKMSFGPYKFEADMTSDDTRGPFFIFWAITVFGNGILALFSNPDVIVTGPGSPRAVVPLLIYGAMALAYVNFLAAYYRAAAEWTRIGNIEFRFSADFNDWILFYFRTIGLTIITLGLAIFVYEFRKWRFVTSHLDAYGNVDVDDLTQSQTFAPREAEGFLDALDIGAF